MQIPFLGGSIVKRKNEVEIPPTGAAVPGVGGPERVGVQ
jgi:hypothetical protein